MTADRQPEHEQTEGGDGRSASVVEAARIKVWFCDECGYWRKEQSTGVHATDDPSDPRGRMVTHQLREVEFIPATGNSVAVPEPEVGGQA